MQLIIENPYRILGLSITATDREIAKRSSDLSIYAEMGKSKSYKYDFSFIGDIDRSLKAIEKAKRQLEQPKDKLIHSIFWLDYDIEETYLDTLNSVNFSETIKIIPDNSIENIHNKAVLLLLSNKTMSNFRNGLLCFDRFFNHPDIDIYTDETIYSAKHSIDLFATFIDNALPLFRKTYTVRKIVNAFENTSKAKYVKEHLLKPILNDIESEIDLANIKMKKNDKRGKALAEQLIFNIEDNYNNLKEILGKNDIRFATISNKLAVQIINCTIIYFNKNNTIDSHIVAKKSIDLLNTAKQFIIDNNRLLKRINDSILTMKGWLIEDSECETGSNKTYYNESTRLKINKAKRKSNGYIYDPDKYLQIAVTLLTDCMPYLNNKPKDDLLKIAEYYKISYDLVNVSLTIIENYFILMKSDNKFGDSQKRKVLSIFSMLSDVKVNKPTKKRKDNLYIRIQGYQKITSFRAFCEKYSEHKQNEEKGLKDDLDRFKKNNEKRKTEPQKGKILNRLGCITVLIVLTIIIILSSIPKDKTSIANTKAKETITQNAAKERKNEIKKQNDPLTSAPLYEREKTRISTQVSKYKGNQLANGSSPYNSYFGKGIYNKNHHNTITFKNGYDTDAIVCLVDYYSGKTIRNEYIQKGTNFTMTNVPNGRYFLKVLNGNDWNPEKSIANGKLKGGFETNVGFSVSDNSEDILVIEDDGYSYSIYSITLYNVENGNLESEPINEEEFFQ